MQHLLLALSIITLTIIAGNDRHKTPVDNGNKILKIEQPNVNSADEEFPMDQPVIYFTRFDLFLN
jgi:hypothetical protein